jgi:hypothetical protein
MKGMSFSRTNAAGSFVAANVPSVKISYTSVKGVDSDK